MAEDGRLDEAKGRAKEALGDLTNDRRMRGEGKVDRAQGGAKGAMGGLAARIKGMFRRT
ncbi:MAG TPA: CsbD family protein [Acidimicrobiales bacterium]